MIAGHKHGSQGIKTHIGFTLPVYPSSSLLESLSFEFLWEALFGSASTPRDITGPVENDEPFKDGSTKGIKCGIISHSM